MPKSIASSGLILQQKSPNDIKSFLGGLQGCKSQHADTAHSTNSIAKVVHQGSGHTSLGSITHRGLLGTCPARPRSLLLGHFTLVVNKQHLNGDVGVTTQLSNTWCPSPSPASGMSHCSNLQLSRAPDQHPVSTQLTLSCFYRQFPGLLIFQRRNQPL